MADLKGRTALVTGAARGIGAAIARALARKGALVYVAANDLEDRLVAVAKECSELNGSGRALHGVFDFLQEGDAQKMVAAGIAAMGRVDVLVNNAGIRISRPFGEFTGTDFDQVVGVNLKAPFLASQAVIPSMKANGGGRIIHIASQMGLVTDREISLYGLTKAALIHLTKSMAFELAPFNIGVNAVSPGPIMTEFNAARVEGDPARKARRESYIPVGRYGRPEEVAEAVAFLACAEGAFIQGHNLVVDGGYVTH